MPQPRRSTKPPEKNVAERAFPTVMRYAGLAIALYEGFIDRPPQALAVGLAALMMAGAQVLERYLLRKVGAE